MSTPTSVFHSTVHTVHSPERTTALHHWLAQVQPNSTAAHLINIAGDASSRRYFRLQSQDQSHIVIDAPPATTNNANFIRMATALRHIGLNTPTIISSDLTQGFLLISDLGQQHYLDQLTPVTVDRLYGDALAALIVLQAAGPMEELPHYDAALLQRELTIFLDWLVTAWLQYPLTTAQHQLFNEVSTVLIASALEQPQVCVHRDYHSRNLMVTSTANPGILDFQDAVVGPVTYDLMSLLRDCYIAWPTIHVEEWAWGYFNLAVQSGIVRPQHETKWWQWCDLMGMQRHLKAAGIFARLAIRDGKRGYLIHIPRTLNYVTTVATHYPSLITFGQWLQDELLPRINAALRVA
ncbi:aminoglycoside phosphotransferase family protein [Thiospirillum jenense]|uniref:Phosphotransferase n=1 Tax=Thiospirillum jenense TaxID=1653858 RepID=A0A839HP22_9GAMM|nr:phosphotransferase [Thiospirillum jenense]MBB1127022.1 phosphotransferase [Thiospirillum jenense]